MNEQEKPIENEVECPECGCTFNPDATQDEGVETPQDSEGGDTDEPSAPKPKKEKVLDIKDYKDEE